MAPINVWHLFYKVVHFILSALFYLICLIFGVCCSQNKIFLEFFMDSKILTSLCICWMIDLQFFRFIIFVNYWTSLYVCVCIVFWQFRRQFHQPFCLTDVSQVSWMLFCFYASTRCAQWKLLCFYYVPFFHANMDLSVGWATPLHTCSSEGVIWPCVVMSCVVFCIVYFSVFILLDYQLA